MGQKLNNPPVYYTVAQVQFNPILDLEGYVPAIQGRMREARFPDFKQEVFQRVVLPFGGVDPSQMAAPSLAPQSRYSFGDIEGKAKFVLETNAISFQTTDYQTFEALAPTRNSPRWPNKERCPVRPDAPDGTPITG